MRGERVWMYLIGALVVALGFAAVYPFVKPAPPPQITVATGPEDGAYWHFAELYRAELAKSGVELVLRPTVGAVENVDLLQDPASGVDAGFVQGGLLGVDGADGLRALGTVFVEPVWVFSRLQPLPDRLDQLRGKRVAIDAERSGTSALALQLLAISGVGPKDATFLPLGNEAAADALIAGDADAIFLVAEATSPLVRQLAATPGIGLVDLRRAEAYRQAYPFLEHVVLNEGALDLGQGIPGSDIDLVAPKAVLVVRDDMHSALINLMMLALTRIHASGDVFSPPGTYPSPHGTEVPLADEAQRFYEHGPPILMRYLPFGAATLVDRAAILLLPILTLLVPLGRILPAAVDWRIKSRVWRRYAELADIERQALGGETLAAREALARVEGEITKLKLPISHAHLAYHLRQHVDLVRRRVDDIANRPP
ncbi:MAG: TAXI family TRAP transporter solute-binding subunit [Geminicoccaceae bacterium]